MYQDKIKKMKLSGYVPCLVTETNPNNYQAWVRVSKEKLEPKIATTICKELAKQYVADLNSVDWSHFGRLAGFTNCKEIHKDEIGLSPFMKLHVSNKDIAVNGSEIVQNTINLQKALKKVREKEKIRLEKLKIPLKLICGKTSETEYKKQAR